MKKIIVLLLIVNFPLSIINCNAQALSDTASTVQNVSCHGGNNGVATCSPTGGTTPYTYLWAPGGQTIPTEVNLVAATYTITVTDHVGNTATATATVLQPVMPLVVTAWASQASVCPGASDSLHASSSGGSAPYSYTWTGPIGGISCGNCQNTSVYPYGAAYVVMAVLDGAGCLASASVSVTVNPFPYVTIEGPLSPVAISGSDTLIALSPGATSYLWSNGATTNTIIVSPAVTTTYSVKTTNSYGCYDTMRYVVSPNSSGSGHTSGTAISVSPSTSVTTTSYSSGDSLVWFSFIPTDSNNQIIANSPYLGMPVPHTHRLTLFDNSLNMLIDEPMPDIVGANQIRIDISHLHIGSTYYVRASRCPAHANMPGCNPSSGGECNPSMRWDFQMCFRTVPVFVPDDSGNEAPSISQLYYEDRGQIADLNDIPRFDIKAYTNIASPQVYASDSALSFVYGSIDSMQWVDMVLAGSYVQPSEPVFKMQEDSNAGTLNYFKEFMESGGVSKVMGYSRLVYKNVYPNVDMQVYSNADGTKLYFICNPGVLGAPSGNPADIELHFNGANSVSVTGGGGLNINTSFGTLSFAPGYAYTDSAGIIKPKSWQPYFVTVNSNTVKFNTGAYNTAEPLIIRIDRGHKVNQSFSGIGNLDWCTYYGGTNGNNTGQFWSVTTDYLGNVFTIGSTNAQHFPVLHNIENYHMDTDAVIVKFDASNYGRDWATYYGGSGIDIGRGIIVDGATPQNVYITGITNSPDLTTYADKAFLQSKLNGTGTGPNTDAFVAVLGFTNTNKISLSWATYYGGPGNEGGHAMAWAKSGTSFYVVGDADTNTPVYNEAGAYNDSIGGGALILKFDAADIYWATHVGPAGSGYNACAVDDSSNLYVTGAAPLGYPSNPPNFYGGGTSDALITRFNANNAMQYTSYYGGDGGDVGNGIAIDSHGDVFITGHTYSPSLSPLDKILVTQPTPWNYFQQSNGGGLGGGNAFLAEYVPSFGGIWWGTYFGGNTNIDGAAITIDANNNIYITGNVFILNTDSSFVWPDTGVWPGTGNPPGAFQQQHPANGTYETFLAAFNSYGNYYWGTYVCANSANTSYGYGITTYNGQKLYIVGTTSTAPYEFVNPGGGAWFQDTINHASSIPFISEFNLAGIPTGMEKLTKSNVGNVKLYPNPTEENVTVQIESEKQQNMQFIVFNLLGVPVYSETVNEPAGIINKQIPLSSLPNGNYIIEVLTEKGIEHGKISKLQ